MEEEIKGKKKTLKGEIKEWGIVLVIALVLVYFIKTFLFSIVMVDGDSMYPTLKDGEKIYVSSLSKHIGTLDRFDIIVFEQSKGVHYVKRIIGVEGDKIEYKDDTLYINGKQYDEQYLDESKSNLVGGTMLTEDFTIEEKLGEIEVPKGHYFVLGDNRRNSTDSRAISVGFVSKEAVKGKAKYVTAPIKSIRSLK